MTQGTGKFDYLAAADTQKMLMLCARFHLIVMVLLIEMMLRYQPQLLKKLQVSIYRGQANTRVPPSSPPIQLVCVQMSAAPTEQFQEQSALRCYPLA